MQKLSLLIIAGLFFALPAKADMMAMKAKVKLGIGARPGVMFVTLHNKGAATRLISAASNAFARIELHTHQTDTNGMMRMVQVDGFSVPANGILALKPGGHHLMLFGFTGDKEGDVTVTLQFADGRTVPVKAKPSQRAKPKHKKMHHHAH